MGGGIGAGLTCSEFPRLHEALLLLDLERAAAHLTRGHAEAEDYDDEHFDPGRSQGEPPPDAPQG